MIKTNIFLKALSVLIAVVLAPFYALTYGIDAISLGKRCESSSANIVGIGAYFRSQGMTSDENGNLYFSSKTTLIKTEPDGRTLINANLKAIPDELSEECGIKHIGGISWYNGLIYAGMEDSKVWDHPIIGVFDSETLEIKEWFELDSEVHTRGLPWVAVDKGSGTLYAFDHSKQPKEIIGYDIAGDMEMKIRTPLNDIIPSIQGGEFLGGMLLVATNDETQAIYSVNVSDGSFSKLLDRNLTGGSEGEGMTIVDKDGKTCILAMDMGPLFINANLRWYPVEEYIQTAK